MSNSFEDLIIWQKAHSITLEIYKITKTFPLEEKFRLTDQLKRASSSISANIAEGHGRHHYLDEVKFLYQARGSLEEVRNHLMLARDLEYLTDEVYKELSQNCLTLAKGLNSYITSIRKRIN